MGKVLKFETGGVVGNGRVVAVEGILRGARKAKLSQIVLVGYDEDGELYVAASHSAADALMALERAKGILIE